jgi:hypothetical protein
LKHDSAPCIQLLILFQIYSCSWSIGLRLHLFPIPHQTRGGSPLVRDQPITASISRDKNFFMFPQEFCWEIWQHLVWPFFTCSELSMCRYYR